MTTKRAYYDCPLISAYMYKYHNIRFQQFNDETGQLVDVNLCDILDQVFETDPKRFYYDPESMYLLEPKMRKDMESSDVLAKKEAAIKWCSHASDYAKTYGGKPWVYVLIPHDVIADNMTLDGLNKMGGG